jgi:CheY-like chemotaxis protein
LQTKLTLSKNVHAMKRILLVEDSVDDVVFLKHSLKSVGRDHELHVATDEEDAIAYLKRVEATAYTENSEVPDSVLLDIKLPKIDGYEVLAWIRQQKRFLGTPVIMFSSSDRRDDVLKALSLNAP